MSADHEWVIKCCSQLSSLFDVLYAYVWGAPLLALIVGIGLYFTIFLRGLQFRYLGYALKLVVGAEKDRSGKGDISNFQSLMTALAATIGIGNIAGVATAVVVGGPGALFWMWITALIGMAIKYAEAFLAIRYRVVDKNGEMAGGPMFFIEHGLKMHWLAFSFALFGAIAAFGGGNMLQANSVADALYNSLSIDHLWSGIAMAIIAALTLVGGIKSIGKVASVLVPFMAFVYIGGALIVLVLHFDQIPMAFWNIVVDAFTGQAIMGGAAGSSLLLAMQVGISRGVMTSEAGLGTASIAAAAAKTDAPGTQALISMTGCFLATIIMCTVTALVLGVTGVYGSVDPQGKLVTGAALTIQAFNSTLSWGGYVVAFGLVFFGFTTIVGWAYYGEKCIEYIFGEKGIIPYRIVFILMIIPGAILDLEIVWKISDVFNGLMAYPNLLGLCLLSKLVIKETKVYLDQI